ncbi:family 1 glycosylhydrolase [Lentzea alba]|uniref:glycoside hydrolase family 1 protein n=1 Tax=Lentzea alba TaxID=2714351 RepID=UPI0039BF5D99
MREWHAASAGDLDPTALTFPAEFLFGAATSAHQVEGGTCNNWTLWERTRLAAGERCGRAVDHWHRFESDLGLMRWLGLQVYRFSVEWSRIELLPGHYDDVALGRYRAWCEALRDAGILPMVTLHHFTEPVWITERGGFENPATGETWVRFVEHVVAHLGDLVSHWITVNEPTGYAVQGWWRGEWPPGRTDPAAALRVIDNLLVAHSEAYRAIHRAGAGHQVGLAHNIAVFLPAKRYSPLDRLAAGRLHRAYNLAVLDALATGSFEVDLPGLTYSTCHDAVRGTQDFLGLNHYYALTVRVRPFAEDQLDVGFSSHSDKNDLGWSLDPTTLAAALAAVSPYGLPILVTEHGACDAAVPDVRRRRFLAHSLQVLREAMAEGADVRMYIHWSLIDNFEWAYGFSPRFGLFRVDHTTLERFPTTSADFYRELIAAHRADSTKSGGDEPGQGG